MTSTEGRLAVAGAYIEPEYRRKEEVFYIDL